MSSSIRAGCVVSRIEVQNESTILICEWCMSWASSSHDSAMGHPNESLATTLHQHGMGGKNGEELGETYQTVDATTANTADLRTSSLRLKQRLTQIQEISNSTGCEYVLYVHKIGREIQLKLYIFSQQNR